MYKNILVITDNVLLSSRLEQIILNISKDHIVTFAISPFTEILEFTKQLKSPVNIINLKSSKHVKKVIENYDLVISIHCKQIFPKELVNNVKCINIHPGYNPINRGWYPQVFAILNELPIGATIHEIDEELDHGPIIAREFVDKYAWDTSKDIYDRVLEKEIELLKKNLHNILKGNYNTIKPEENYNLFLKKDFNKLLNLDLNEVGSFKSFITRLRALSHGTYKNAYFIDPESGKKVFVKIDLQIEDEEN
jgi:dTDP-4-amino-4,6-dideoxyglucose formyltransferase